MKLETKTSKLYYGFPVILIGYKDRKWKYNVTTCSSSYSLGDMIIVGLRAESNSVDNIKEYGEFTVNVPCQQILSKVEIAGFHSGQNKIGMADMTYDPAKYIDAPIMDECILSLECKVENIVEYGKYTNFNPIYFMGDDNKRVYRYFNEESKNHGENMGCSSEDDYNPLCG